ncbi:MAG: DUF805 domain-containing protein [Bacteroidales bacterium]|nr:DUF805 domain-containing protein [Bacteroidales bacterium]
MDEFIAIVKKVFLDNYFNFDGRANRKEFWYAFLAYFVVNLIIGFIPGWVGLILRIVWWLATLLPILGVGCRRLHDINKEGLYLLLGLIPIAGIIILIVWWAQEGDPNENQYGPVPETPKAE